MFLVPWLLFVSCHATENIPHSAPLHILTVPTSGCPTVGTVASQGTLFPVRDGLFIPTQGQDPPVIPGVSACGALGHSERSTLLPSVLQHASELQVDLNPAPASESAAPRIPTPPTLADADSEQVLGRTE